MKDPGKIYLGDSVYAAIDPDGRGIVLTTENGIPEDPSNTIFLDSSVVDALLKYVERVRES